MPHIPTGDESPVTTPTEETASVAVPRVLVADGDAESRDQRAAQLRASGCRVSVARTLFETIVKASCQIPDLILLDDSIGDSDAAETTRLLSTCPMTAHIPIVRLRPGRRLPRTVLGAAPRRAAAG